MCRRLLLLLFCCCLIFSLSITSAAYTVGQQPPNGLTAGAPYIKVDVAGQQGYIYPTAAQMDTLAITADDLLCPDVSAYNPSGTANSYQVVRYLFSPSPGFSSIAVLHLVITYGYAPYLGATQYPVTWGWYRATGTATGYFNGNLTPVNGDITVLDTNVPAFSPKSQQLSQISPMGYIEMISACALVLSAILLAVSLVRRRL